MRTKFSISILVLVILFAANLSNRILSKNLRTSYTITEQTTSECEPENLSGLTRTDLLQLISVTVPKSSSLLGAEHLFIEKNDTANPTVNLLYLAHAPPFFYFS